MNGHRRIPNFPLFLYNTETRRKERFIPRDTSVLMYTCGPTVYDYAHIGNFRTYVFEDVLKRTLQTFGYDVKQVMNLTDVDDKTIKGATKQGVSLDTFTAPYIRAFFEDIEILGISPAAEYPRATHYIPQMIEAIDILKKKGRAYSGNDGSVYFSIDKLDTYGRLCKLSDSHHSHAGTSSSDEYDKDNVCDFTLWKAYDPERDGEIYWDSPFGKGRPGWHLECSVMAMQILGETIDIHAGGVDNIFPHHENEIAQSESLSDKTFVKYWVHSEHLLVNGKKMSKSLGNFYRLKDLLNKGFSGKEIRYALLQSHYRTQLNFSEKMLKGCKQAVKKLQDFIERIESIPETKLSENQKRTNSDTELFLRTFAKTMANDLNVSEALATLFQYIKKITDLEQLLGYDEAATILGALKEVNRILNVLSFNKGNSIIPTTVLELIAEREIARSNKDWKKSDILRDMIAEKGFSIEDKVTGYRIKKIEI
ncbi:MAG: cysteine--tRNA ligase [Victivallaceae bacterium]